MIAKLLARSHYEIHGTHEGFEYFELLQSDNSIEEFYKLIGFDSTYVDHKTTHDYRKLHAQKNTKELLLKTKLTTAKEVSAFLKSASAYAVPQQMKEYKNIDELSIRVLATYYRENCETLYQGGSVLKEFSEYIRSLAVSCKDEKEFRQMISAESFGEILKSSTPNFVYKKGCKPTISMGTMLLPTKLSVSGLERLIQAALEHAVFKSLDVPPAVYFDIIGKLPKMQRLSNDAYLRIVDAANSMNLTVKQLIELCGVKYIDRLEYFKKHGVIVYQESTEAFSVYNVNSVKDSKFLTMNGDAVNYLNRLGVLPSLSWDNQGAYVEINDTLLSVSDVLAGGLV